MTAREQAIDRVRKLAEVTTEHGATQPEQDNAIRLAQRLILKHRITYAECVSPAPRVRTRPAPAHPFVGQPHWPPTRGSRHASGGPVTGVTFTVGPGGIFVTYS